MFLFIQHITHTNQTVLHSLGKTETHFTVLGQLQQQIDKCFLHTCIRTPHLCLLTNPKMRCMKHSVVLCDCLDDSSLVKQCGVTPVRGLPRGVSPVEECTTVLQHSGNVMPDVAAVRGGSVVSVARLWAI